jgi:hypothetical protein
MRRNDHALRVWWWWMAPMLAVALACGSAEETPRPSGTAMAAPPPVEENEENAAPVVESIALNPPTPLPGTSILANVEVYDPDGDAYRVTFDWKVNGELAASGRQPRFVAQDVRKDDRIEVTVVATDGRLESEPISARARVGNRPPLLQGVLLEPQGTVRSGDELLASPEANDPDEDPLSFEYLWLVNGSETNQRGRTFSTRGLDRGDKVKVRVLASDGTDTSRAAESPEITIGNSPPLIEKIPTLQSESGFFRYAFQAKDPDGDRNLRFRLREAPEGMRIDPILGVVTWRPKPSQAGVHQVDVLVEDSQGDGSALRFEVTVTATPGDSGEPPPPAASP